MKLRQSGYLKKIMVIAFGPSKTPDQHLTYRDAMRLVKNAGYTPYDVLETFHIPLPEEEQSAESANAEEFEN